MYVRTFKLNLSSLFTSWLALQLGVLFVDITHSFKGLISFLGLQIPSFCTCTFKARSKHAFAIKATHNNLCWTLTALCSARMTN